MKLTSILSVALLGCGGGSGHNPDASPDSTPIDSAPPSTTLTITTYRTAGPINTQLVAVQDGDGAWTALTGTSGVYTATLHTDRYGVLVACTSTMFGGGPAVFYAAVSDGTKLYFSDCDDPGAPAANISGAITGAAPANPTRIIDAFFGQTDVPAGTTTYTLGTLAGPERLIAEELVGMRPIKLATVDTNVTDGATVNFDLAAGFAPVTKAVSANAPIGAVSVTYRDAKNFSRIDRVTAPFNNYRAMPADKLGSGLNRLSVSTADGTGTNVIRYFKNPTDQTITFPAAIALTQQPTATKVPYPNVSFTVPIRADQSQYDLSATTTNMTTMLNHGWSAEMTSAWVAKAFPGASTFTYTLPDLRSLAGWQTVFQPEAGIPLDWSVSWEKTTNIDWFPTVPPNTMFDHDGGELSIPPTVSGQLPAP